MRVVHIAATLRGGAGIGLLRQHLALRADGVDSRILVGDADGVETDIARPPVTAHSLLLRAARRLGLARDGETQLNRALRTLDAAAGSAVNYELFSIPHSYWAPEDHSWVEAADVVNLHWVAGVLDWPRFFRKTDRPVIFTLHDQQSYLGGSHYQIDADGNPHLRGLETDVREIKRAALGTRPVQVVGNSRWNTDEARASGFFPPGSAYHAIPYPLDCSIYRQRPKNAVRGAFGLDDHSFVVGFASSDLGNRRKGFDTLIAALRALPEAVRNRVRLLSFGREPTQTLRASVPLSWTHLGSLDSDVAKVAAYSAMDLFVIPSRAEAFGLTAIESLACGTPVIGSRVGGIPEALPESSRACLFDPNDVAEISRVISSLSSDRNRMADLAAEGRQHVECQHAPQRIAAAYTAVYRAALETSQSTPRQPPSPHANQTRAR